MLYLDSFRRSDSNRSIIISVYEKLDFFFIRSSDQTGKKLLIALMSRFALGRWLSTRADMWEILGNLDLR